MAVCVVESVEVIQQVGDELGGQREGFPDPAEALYMRMGLLFDVINVFAFRDGKLLLFLLQPNYRHQVSQFLRPRLVGKDGDIIVRS